MPYIPRSSAGNRNGASAIPKIVKKKHTFRVFGFLASVMIAGAFLSVIGAFGYNLYVEAQLDDAKSRLVALSESETDLGERIDRLQAFDDRLSLTEHILDNHLAPSKLFTLLEENTKETVQFSSLTYTYDPGFQALLDLEAGTDAFSSVALQNNQLMDVGNIYTEYVLEEVANSVSADAPRQSEPGAVTDHPVSFTVLGDLDLSSLAYTGQDVVERVEDALPVNSNPFNETSDASEVQLESEQDVVENTSPQTLPPQQ